MGRVSDAKERLMGAVRELIWEGSYGSTTIDQICEKAGVKKGSFY
ncbi:MAG: TetR/AcrR family transcriptional regulator, partial [Verrucomicrobia bacterium]